MLSVLVAVAVTASAGGVAVAAEGAAPDLAGVVVDGAGQPVPGAVVDLPYVGGLAPAVTDAAGAFTLDVPADGHDVRVYPPVERTDLAVAFDWFRATSEEPTLSVTLPVATLRGTVRAPDGSPLTEQARLDIDAVTGSSYSSDHLAVRPDGSFALALAAGDYRVQAHPSYANPAQLHPQTELVTAPAAAPLEIRLNASNVTGRILEPGTDADRPVADAYVAVRLPDGGTTSAVRSAADGSFGLRVPETGSYELSASPRHDERMLHPVVQPLEVTALPVSDLAVRVRASNVRLRVQDAAGAPVEGISVQLHDGTGRSVGERRSSADGAVGFLVAAGTYTPVGAGNAQQYEPAPDPHYLTTTGAPVVVPADGAVDGTLTMRTPADLPYETSVASLDRDGGRADDRSDAPSLSADGRRVAFTSLATDLEGAPGFDSYPQPMVYVRDLDSGRTQLVNVSPAGAAGRQVVPSYDPSPSPSSSPTPTTQLAPAQGVALSADGRHVAFTSRADDLVPGEADTRLDLFVRDLTTQTTERVLASPPADAARPALDADGSVVAFETTADHRRQVVVVDRTAGVVTQVSGTTGRGETGAAPALSRDGRILAYVGVVGGVQRVLVHDRTTGATQDAGSAAWPGTSEGSEVAVSGDGSTVAWVDAERTVRVLDTASGEVRAVPFAVPGYVPSWHSIAVDRTGRTVAFGAETPGDFLKRTQLFRHDRVAGTTELVTTGVSGDGLSVYASYVPDVGGISDAGTIAFASVATDVLPSWSGSGDVYLATPRSAAPAWPDGAALTASEVTSGSVTLTWTAASDDQGVTAYRVLRDGAEPLTVTTGRTATVTGLQPDTEHGFRVEAVDATGRSTAGPAVRVRTAPLAAEGKARLAAELESGTVRLAWDAAAPDGLTGYVVLRATGDGAYAPVAEVAAGATSWADPGAPSQARLRYTVAAVHGTGRTPHTAAAEVTTPALAAPTVSWVGTFLSRGVLSLGSELVVRATADPHRTVTATVTRTVDGADVTTAVAMAPTAAGSRDHVGRLPLAEGTAAVTAVTATVSDGAGSTAEGRAGGLPVAVSGAVRVALDVPAGALPSARVVLADDASGTGRQATTTGGPVTLLAVPSTGSAVRVFDPAGRLLVQRATAVEAGRTTALTLAPGLPASLVVRVAFDGRPVPGARVTVTGADGFASGGGTTDDAGAVRVDELVSGTPATVRVVLPSSSSLPAEATATGSVASLSAGEQEIAVAPAALGRVPVSGRVVRGDGSPVSGMRLTLTQRAGDRTVTTTATTDSQGDYALSGIAGPGALGGVHPQGTAARDLVLVAGTPLRADIAFVPSSGYALALDVRTKRPGEPEERVTLDPALAGALDLVLEVDGVRVSTAHLRQLGDGLGIVRVPARPGNVVRLCGRPRSPGQLLAPVCVSTTLGSDLAVSLPTLVLALPSEVRARLVDGSGAPLADAWTAVAYRTVDGARASVATREGAGSDLRLSLGQAGDHEIVVTSERGTATRTTAVGTSDAVDLGTVALEPARYFGGDDDRVTAGRTQVLPGGTVDLRATFRNRSSLRLPGVVARIEVPAGTSLVPGSVVLDGRPVTPTGTDVAVGDLARGAGGTLRYALRLDTGVTATRLAPTVRMVVGSTSEPLHPAGLAVVGVTLSAPTRVATRDVVVTGRAPAGDTVAVVVGGETRTAAVASAAGYWRAAVTLPGTAAQQSYFVHAVATREGRAALHSADAVVAFDAAQPVITRVTLSQVTGSYSFDPRQGTALFPFVYKPGAPLTVEASFSDPDRVRDVVAHAGGGSAAATRQPGGRYRATVEDADGRGDLWVDYEVAPAPVDRSAGAPTESAVRQLLPRVLSDFVVEDVAQAEGSGRATLRLPSAGGGAMTVSASLERGLTYAPTEQDVALADAAGVPLWGVEVTEGGGGTTQVSAYLPETALAGGALRSALRRGTRTASVVAAAVPAARMVFQVALPTAEAGASVYSATLGSNYGEIGDLASGLADCTADVAAPYLTRVQELLDRNADYDKLGVAINLTALLLAPETFGIGTLVVAGAGAMVGAVLSVDVARRKAALEDEIGALNCQAPEGRRGGKGSPLGSPVWIHDPSGFVFEGVASNRLQGVTATLMHSTSPTGPWAVWDAGWYGQVNPLVTNTEGRYGWDVPEGFWQVLYTKDGYEPGRSEVLEVLPPHFDVDEPLVAHAAPEVTGVTAAGQGVEVVFSKHMRPATVSGRVGVRDAGGQVVPGTVTAVGAEPSPTGELLARTFRFTPAAALPGGTELAVTVDAGAESYSRRPLVAAVTRTVRTAVVAGPTATPTSTPTTAPGAPLPGSPVEVPGPGRPGTSPAPSPTASSSATASPAATASPSPSGPAGGASAPGRYAPLTEPVRALDTRSAGALAGRRLGDVRLRLPSSVPADATAVLLNVTVTGGAGNGHVVVHAAGTTTPATSNVNFVAGQTQANLVMTRTGGDREVVLRVHGSPAHLVVDVVGAYRSGAAPSGLWGALRGLVGLDAPAEGTVATAPSRVLDTRTGTGTAVGARTGAVRLQLPSSVPAEATAVLLNVTATGSRTAGHVTAYPAGDRHPGTSNVNVVPGRTQANLVLVGIGADRSVVLDVEDGPMHLVGDLVGYRLGEGAALPARRVLDTRTGQGGVKGDRTGPVTLTLPSSVPADARAVVLNVTATAGAANGHVTAHAGGSPRPATSNVNYRRGQTQANLVVTRVGPGRTVVLDVHGGAVHLVADLVAVHE